MLVGFTPVAANGQLLVLVQNTACQRAIQLKIYTDLSNGVGFVW